MRRSKTSTAPSQVQSGPRSEATRAMIMDAAEKMIAKDGVEGVALRQIRVAVGSSNTNVVTYHFGSKDGLIEAIVMDRHPVLERRRAELLTTARARGLGNDVSVLLHAVWYPYFELKNSDGRHTYAAFLASIAKTHAHWVNKNLEHRFPIEFELRRLIAELLPNSIEKLFLHRSNIVFAMITAALQCCDDVFHGKPVQSKKLFEAALRMATVAIQAP
jgi:AcrR family transcriptional regulator